MPLFVNTAVAPEASVDAAFLQARMQQVLPKAKKAPGFAVSQHPVGHQPLRRPGIAGFFWEFLFSNSHFYECNMTNEYIADLLT